MKNLFKYPASDRIFELDYIDGYIYRFKCGHWCTDSVFSDLIQISGQGILKL